MRITYRNPALAGRYAGASAALTHTYDGSGRSVTVVDGAEDAWATDFEAPSDGVLVVYGPTVQPLPVSLLGIVDLPWSGSPEGRRLELNARPELTIANLTLARDDARSLLDAAADLLLMLRRAVRDGELAILTHRRTNDVLSVTGEIRVVKVRLSGVRSDADAGTARITSWAGEDALEVRLPAPGAAALPRDR